MTQPHLFSLTGHPELAPRAHAVFAAQDAGGLDDLRAKVRSFSDAYIDTIVDGMIMAFISPADENTRSAGLVRNLASLIKSVSHGLVKSAVGGAKREELDKIVAYVRGQLVLAPEHASIEFALAPGTRDGFARVIEAKHAGRVESERKTLMHTMLAFVDEALAHYLTGPFSQLELGFLVRKALDVGHASIRAAARTAIQHALGDDGDSDVNHLVGFFDAAIVRG